MGIEGGGGINLVLNLVKFLGFIFVTLNITRSPIIYGNFFIFLFVLIFAYFFFVSVSVNL